MKECIWRSIAGSRERSRSPALTDSSRPPREPLGKFQKVTLQSKPPGLGGPGTRNDHHIPGPLQAPPVVSDDLAEPSLDPIPNHGIAHLSAHSDAKSGRVNRCRNEQHDQMRLPEALAAGLNRLVVRSTANPLRRRKAIRKGHGVGDLWEESPLFLASLGADSGNQALAPLGPSVLEDTTTTRCSHTGTESMAPLPLDIARLIRTLHDNLLETDAGIYCSEGLRSRPRALPIRPVRSCA